jgi:GT2 family glycosyltransferase
MKIDEKISFVVLSWNKLDDTKSCLKSIRNVDYKNYEIIVVDNGSNDGSKEWLSRQKDIVYVDLPKNTGFTGGQLAAYDVAKGDYLALINNDAVIAPDWIKEALKSFSKDKKVAVVGGRAYKWAEGEKKYSEINDFYSYQVIDLYNGSAETLMTGDNEAEVNSISGAGVIIKRKVIEKIGYFDDRFFAYYEETDLFARMKRAGYKIIYNPNVKTWHKIGQSTKSNPYFYLYQMNKNRFLFAFKNFDKPFANKMAKSYIRQSLVSFKNIIKGSSDINDKAMVEAFKWNIANIFETIKSRKNTLKLGKKYNNLLVNDDCQNVSIIITCYNYEKYIEESINSALGQSQQPLEVIVVNDGSTDDSLKKIKKYKDKVKILNKKNEGLIKAKNDGLKLAKGHWVIFLDADDILDKDYLKKTLKVARLKNSSVVYTDMNLFGSENKKFKSMPFSLKSLRKNNFIHNSALIKRDLAMYAGGYKKEMSGGYEDWEFYISLAEKNAKMTYLEESLLNYRQHEAGGRNDNAGLISDQLVRTIEKLHPKTFNSYYKFIKYLKKLFHYLLKIIKILKILWPPFWIRFFNARPRINEKLKNPIYKQELNQLINKTIAYYKKLNLLKAFKYSYMSWNYYYELGRIKNIKDKPHEK